MIDLEPKARWPNSKMEKRVKESGERMEKEVKRGAGIKWKGRVKE